MDRKPVSVGSGAITPFLPRGLKCLLGACLGAFFLLLTVPVFAETITLTEEGVFALALEQNLGVKIAEAERAIGKTGIQGAKSAFDTLLEWNVDHLINKSDQAIPIFGTDNRTTNFNLGLSKVLPSGTRTKLEWANRRESTDSAFSTLNPYYESGVEFSLEQPILKDFFGMQERGGVKIARKQFYAIDALSQRKIAATVYQVLVDYWDWVTRRQIVRVTQRSLREARHFEKLAYEKKSLGLYESTDVLAAKANRLQTQNQLATATMERGNSRGRLQRDLNLSRTATLTSTETVLFHPELPDRETALVEAIENRSDYRATRTTVEEKKIALSLAKNNRWPELDLVASLKLNGVNANYGDGLGEIGGGDHPAYFFGANFSWPIENRLARSETRRAEWEKMKALFELKQMENRVTQEVEEEWRELESWSRQVKANRRIEQLQREKWQQEFKKYRSGRSSSDLVIRYQEDYLTAQRITLQSLFRYRVAALGLQLATHQLIP